MLPPMQANHIKLMIFRQLHDLLISLQWHRLPPKRFDAETRGPFHQQPPVQLDRKRMVRSGKRLRKTAMKVGADRFLLASESKLTNTCFGPLHIGFVQKQIDVRGASCADMTEIFFGETDAF